MTNKERWAYWCIKCQASMSLATGIDAEKRSAIVRLEGDMIINVDHISRHLQKGYTLHCPEHGTELLWLTHRGWVNRICLDHDRAGCEECFGEGTRVHA